MFEPMVPMAILALCHLPGNVNHLLYIWQHNTRFHSFWHHKHQIWVRYDYMKNVLTKKYLRVSNQLIFLWGRGHLYWSINPRHIRYNQYRPMKMLQHVYFTRKILKDTIIFRFDLTGTCHTNQFILYLLIHITNSMVWWFGIWSSNLFCICLFSI